MMAARDAPLSTRQKSAVHQAVRDRRSRCTVIKPAALDATSGHVFMAASSRSSDSKRLAVALRRRPGDAKPQSRERLAQHLRPGSADRSANFTQAGWIGKD